jgi:uncharacterized membrane protein
MKRFTLVLTFCLTLCLALSPITTSAAQRRSGSRVRYSAAKRTSSHGGHYAGGRGSSQKGERYRNVSATALCADGTYSYSANRRGTCSHHGGVAQWFSR